MINSRRIWNDKRKCILYILCSFIVILIAYLPNLQKGIYTGMDLSFHLNRIDSLAEGLRNGVFPVKLHATRAYGYGYGVGFFYCNFFLYIPALLINLGMDLLTAYKIFLFMIYMGIFGAMFFSVRKLTDNSEAAFWAAAFYLFSSKVMGAVYITGAVGEITAYIFTPLAIAGIYTYLIKNEYPYMLMTGFLGLILSHTISTFLVLAVCAGIAFFYCGKLLKNKRKIVHLILAVICVASLTVGFWLPMFEQMRAQDLRVNYPWTVSENNVETISNILSGEYSLGRLMSIVFIINIFVILGLLIKKRKEEVKKVFVFVVIAAFMTFLTTYKYFWHVMNDELGIKFLQFPYRLFSSVTVLILFTFAMLYQGVKVRSSIKRIFVLAILCYGVYVSYETYSGYYLNVGYDEINMVVEGQYPGLGGGQEWLPAETDFTKLVDCTLAYDNEGNRTIGEKLNGCNIYTFVAEMSKEYYDVPCLWYKGFVAENSEGERLITDKETGMGLLRVYTSDKQEGEELITVYYEGTLIQKIAYIANIFGGALLIAYYILCKKDLLKIESDNQNMV